MAKSKDDISYGTAQARLTEDDALRIRYKAGTPLEGGKIADSQPVDLFSSARNIGDQQGKIAESQPVDLSSSARNIAAAKQPQQEEKTRDSSNQGKNNLVYEDENMDKNLPPAAATLMFDGKTADNLTTNPP
ncbi:SEED MATURATION PROTEIN 1 [Lycium barbarum]|uniref:SEED MATURATION PROTEIN 1 n=1 Tax=Lycium barbarum TaxID=112863 RepID=UPI00293EA541|nr:SEED MATURATION PROTEIN 1 [Lycium barbarum]